MKKIFGFLFILYLAQSTLCKNQIQTACQRLNPFLPIIQQEAVFLFDTVQKSNNLHQCSYEWSKYGTCCSYDSIVSYAIKDKQKMIYYQTQLASHFSTIGKTFQKIQRLATELSKKFPATHQQYKDFLYFMESSDTKVYRDYLLGRVPSQETPQGFAQCLSSFENARTTSLCSVCSGRSSQWFLDQKAKMNQRQCGYILQKCSKTFYTVFRYIESLGKFVLKVHSLQIDRMMSTSDRNSANNLQDAIAKIAGLHIFEIVMRYLEATSPKEKISAGAEVCSSLVTLAHVPFLRGLESLIGSVANYLEHWFGHCSRLASENLKLTSPTNWSSRRLLESGPDIFEVTGDVIISITQYSSITVSPHNIADSANTIVMDLQKTFP